MMRFNTTRNKKWLSEALSIQGLNIIHLEDKPVYLGHIHEDVFIRKKPFPFAFEEGCNPSVWRFANA